MSQLPAPKTTPGLYSDVCVNPATPSPIYLGRRCFLPSLPFFFFLLFSPSFFPFSSLFPNQTGPSTAKEFGEPYQLPQWGQQRHLQQTSFLGSKYTKNASAAEFRLHSAADAFLCIQSPWNVSGRCKCCLISVKRNLKIVADVVVSEYTVCYHVGPTRLLNSTRFNAQTPLQLRP